MEKILTILWCRRKLSILWCMGCNPFFSYPFFNFDFIFVQSDVRHFFHMWKVKRAFDFFPSPPNLTHTLQNTPKTTRICGHLQNKPYKSTSGFLPNLTKPDEHHTEWKQNQNKKTRIGKKSFFTVCHHTFENPFFLLFLVIYHLAFLHSNYNLDTTI